MAVPRRSAPVFGRYAGVQGVQGVQSWQSWHSCVGARQTWVSGLFQVLLAEVFKCCWQRGEALMAVPRSSAPVFGRYAGVQGVQGWES